MRMPGKLKAGRAAAKRPPVQNRVSISNTWKWVWHRVGGGKWAGMQQTQMGRSKLGTKLNLVSQHDNQLTWAFPIYIFIGL